MERSVSSAALVALHLRQQRELGLREVFLENPELLERLGRAKGAARGTSGPPRSTGHTGWPVQSPPPPRPRPASPSPEPPPGVAERRAEGSPDPRREGARAPLPVLGGQDNAEDPWPQRRDYEALRAEALACVRCPLSRTRTQVVFSDGHPRARLMVVGEAPGEKEDQSGRAFVGPAGKLLDLLLATVGFDRSSTAYICNVLKCRPPGNRDPLPAEIEACTPYLRRQIELVAPRSLLALGRFAGAFLAGVELPLNKLRGEVYSYEGVPVVVTYHPAALLRNPGLTRAAWEDLQLLRQVMDAR